MRCDLCRGMGLNQQRIIHFRAYYGVWIWEGRLGGKPIIIDPTIKRKFFNHTVCFEYTLVDACSRKHATVHIQGWMALCDCSITFVTPPMYTYREKAPVTYVCPGFDITGIESQFANKNWLVAICILKQFAEFAIQFFDGSVQFTSHAWGHSSP